MIVDKDSRIAELMKDVEERAAATQENYEVILKLREQINELERRLAKQQIGGKTVAWRVGSLAYTDYRHAVYTAQNNMLPLEELVLRGGEDSVPEGWQVVPMNPTKEQYDAGSNVGYGIGGSPPSPAWVYEAMLAAAPKP